MKELVDVVMVMVKEVIMKLVVVMEMVLDKEFDVDNEVTKSVDRKVVEKLDDVYFFMKWIKPTFSQGLVLEMILHLKSFVSIKVFSIFYIEVLPLKLVLFVKIFLKCAFLNAFLMNLLWSFFEKSRAFV